LLLTGVVLLGDQASKAAVRHWLAPGDRVAVVPGFFNLVLHYNRGGVFGLFPSWGGAFAVLSAAALLCLLYYFLVLPASQRWERAAVALLMGGTVGNLCDRVRLGRVVDFLDFHLGIHHWPAFNVADAAVTVGVFILLVRILLDSAAGGSRGHAPDTD